MHVAWLDMLECQMVTMDGRIFNWKFVEKYSLWSANNIHAIIFHLALYTD